MTITIDNKEITLSGNSITFLNEKLGLNTKVVPKRLTFDIESKALSIEAVGTVYSPTGEPVQEIRLGNLSLDFDFTEFNSQEFQGKYLNGLFRSVMSRFGLGVHQVISEETGEVEVIVDTPPPAPIFPAWVQPTGAHDAYAKDFKVMHNGKIWESTADANVWEPGVSGWREVT